MNPLNTFLVILLFCIALSCKSRRPEDHASADFSAPQSPSPPEKHSGASEESLQRELNARPWERRPVDIDSFRADVLEVASTMNEPPMKIVASLIMCDQHEIKRLVFLLEAFKETEMQMDLVPRLPAIGTPRRLIVQGLVRRFESAKDIKGLVQLYDSLSPGADRSGVGAARAQMAIQESGLAAGLDVIMKLERPLERYHAVMETIDEWEPRIREGEIKSKIEAIAASMVSPMDYQYKEYILLMVENALRKN